MGRWRHVGMLWSGREPRPMVAHTELDFEAFYWKGDLGVIEMFS